MADIWSYVAGEAKRKDFAVYLILDKTKAADLSFAKADLEIIGKGIEDMPIALNPEMEETQDVLGNNNISIISYAETMEVTPLKVSGESKYSQMIDEMVESRAVLDALELPYLCVKRYKTNSAGAYRAWVQKGIVEPTDFAEGLNGVSTTHTVHFIGDRILGAIDPSTLAFTADTEEASL